MENTVSTPLTNSKQTFSIITGRCAKRDTEIQRAEEIGGIGIVDKGSINNRDDTTFRLLINKSSNLVALCITSYY